MKKNIFHEALDEMEDMSSRRWVEDTCQTCGGTQMVEETINDVCVLKKCPDCNLSIEDDMTGATPNIER